VCALGVAVERLSFIQWGPAFCLWTCWTTVGCLGLLRPGFFQLESTADVVSWQAAQCIYPGIHIILAAVSPQDKKAFINYVTLYLLWWVIAVDGLNQVLYNSPATHQPTAILYNVFGMLSFLVSAMGLGRLASIPLFGKHCARLLIGKAPPIDVARASSHSSRLGRPSV